MVGLCKKTAFKDISRPFRTFVSTGGGGGTFPIVEAGHSWQLGPEPLNHAVVENPL